MWMLLSRFPATPEVQGISTHLLKVTASQNPYGQKWLETMANQISSYLCQSSAVKTSYFRLC